MLILDTSTILNFMGTGNPRLILQNLPEESFFPQAVLDEITREPISVKGSFLVDLIKDRSIQVIDCTENMIELALDLAGAEAPDDLGDGESYAIACAVHSNSTMGIDDRKGRRILAERWPHLRAHFSIDLILMASRRAKLLPIETADLVFFALKNTRMRVPKERREEVVALIGIDKARLCPSLGSIT